jgi:putative transposase
VLLRLVYLSVTNFFGLLRLLVVSDRDKEIEILALRHQAGVPERQLGKARPRSGPCDRVFPAALLHRLPRDVLGRFGLLALGIKAGAPAVWEMLRQAGTGPAPGRTSTAWAGFLRSEADALLACDFFGTVTLTGARLFVLAVAGHATRRIRILGVTAHPAVPWAVQAAGNLVMDLEDAGSRARFLIRDRDGKYPGLFDAVLKDAGIEVAPSGVQMPGMNAVMKRWVPPAAASCPTAP